MAKLTARESLDLLLLKKRLYVIRITGFIKGNTKNKFIEDCIKRGHGESKHLQHIVDVYYSIIEEKPELSAMEMTEVKAIIINKIKI
jgi:hypothetical protein